MAIAVDLAVIGLFNRHVWILASAADGSRQGRRDHAAQTLGARSESHAEGFSPSLQDPALTVKT